MVVLRAMVADVDAVVQIYQESFHPSSTLVELAVALVDRFQLGSTIPVDVYDESDAVLRRRLQKEVLAGHGECVDDSSHVCGKHCIPVSVKYVIS